MIDEKKPLCQTLAPLKALLSQNPGPSLTTLCVLPSHKALPLSQSPAFSLTKPSLPLSLKSQPSAHCLLTDPEAEDIDDSMRLMVYSIFSASNGKNRILLTVCSICQHPTTKNKISSEFDMLVCLLGVN
ncbi:hypothetical protein AMTR_s00001p00272440 [Amborella trichopoda]|uniref:Uncharacterized protein n=1 Tax=Amborella trichopoda TaxID=13333 RepID=W1NME3_AMBTC|nr:hypothetical protein AMTR_s00001p00272440 [Amborella trichopoda]